VTTIRVGGIRATGRHGANPGERAEPQAFVVDLEVEVMDRGDHLAETADYREIVAVARGVIEDRSLVLLETMARAVADAVSAVKGVHRARAVVHKPSAATSLGVGDVSVEAVSG
jgi:dihydroneopterin aldolase